MQYLTIIKFRIKNVALQSSFLTNFVDCMHRKIPIQRNFGLKPILHEHGAQEICSSLSKILKYRHHFKSVHYALAFHCYKVFFPKILLTQILSIAFLIDDFHIASTFPTFELTKDIIIHITSVGEECCAVRVTNTNMLEKIVIKVKFCYWRQHNIQKTRFYPEKSALIFILFSSAIWRLSPLFTLRCNWLWRDLTISCQIIRVCH